MHSFAREARRTLQGRLVKTRVAKHDHLRLAPFQGSFLAMPHDAKHETRYYLEA